MTYRLTILILAGLALAGPVRAQTGEIQFVFGSDTSTGGFDLSRPSTMYNAGGADLYSSPTGNGMRVMADAFRAGNTDWYGDPLRMTWWMQSGSLYANAENTNVPLGSTMSPYRMRTYLGEAMQRHGDEFTFHYHTWVWTDYDGDGTWWWNQALSFEDSRADFDVTMAEMLLDEDTFPASFRSGWHYMDDAWQGHLDRLVPFSLHNDWPHVRNDTVEPTDNIYDWSRSPSEFVPFHPSTTDYQVPGDGKSWNVRSIYFGRATDALLRDVFAAALDGQDQVVCIWSHLAEATFVDDLQAVLDRLTIVAADYPTVPYRYATAVEAMQRWLKTEDHTAPALGVEEIAGGTALRLTADEPIFQAVPYVALKDRYERRMVLAAHEVAPRTWETDPFDPATAALIRIAVTDTVGNLTKETVRFLPDDVWVDDLDPGFETVAGAWQDIESTGPDHVWGTGIHRVSLQEGQEAVARFHLPVDARATYNVFVRFPETDTPASHVAADLVAGGGTVASVLFEDPPAPDVWHYVGTTDLGTADAPFVEISAPGDGQAGAFLALDAVRVSALVRDRQLDLPLPEIAFPDVIAGEPADVTIPVANLGTGTLTLSGLTSATGVLIPGGSWPVPITGPVQIQLPAQLVSNRIGAVRDTLIIHSDDPIEPDRRLPFSVTFRDWFRVADDGDDVGYEESGTWLTSVTQAYGETSRYALMTGNDATATFRVRVEAAGAYEAAYIVPKTENGALRADYLVSIEGSQVDSVRVDQNVGSGFWRSLGLYEVQAGAEVGVTVRAPDADQGNRVLRADAFRLSRMGDELQAVVLDNEDAGQYSEEGDWLTSNAQAWGTSSRYASWGGGQVAVFSATAQVTGVHAVYEIVPQTVNATTQAQYRVLRNGTLVESLVIDQNLGSGSWRVLGAWQFHAGDLVQVELSDAATTNTGVLRADAIRLIFGANSSTAVSGELPDAGWSLGQNWPNPFTERTRFSYSVGAPGRVTVEVFDVLGRRVGRVVDGEHASGVYEAQFDAAGLSSGVYLCRLVAGSRIETRTWIVAR